MSLAKPLLSLLSRCSMPSHFPTAGHVCPVLLRYIWRTGAATAFRRRQRVQQARLHVPDAGSRGAQRGESVSHVAYFHVQQYLTVCSGPPQGGLVGGVQMMVLQLKNLLLLALTPMVDRPLSTPLPGLVYISVPHTKTKKCHKFTTPILDTAVNYGVT